MSARPINWDDMGSSERDLWEERELKAARVALVVAQRECRDLRDASASADEQRAALRVCTAAERRLRAASPFSQMLKEIAAVKSES